MYGSYIGMSRVADGCLDEAYIDSLAFTHLVFA